MKKTSLNALSLSSSTLFFEASGNQKTEKIKKPSPQLFSLARARIPRSAPIASLHTPRSHSDMERPSTGKRRSREATPSDRLESSSATMVFAAETDDDDDDAFPPTPLARRAPPVTTLLDLPPEMLMEVVQRVGDARALAAGERNICERKKKLPIFLVLFIFEKKKKKKKKKKKNPRSPDHFDLSPPLILSPPLLRKKQPPAPAAPSATPQKTARRGPLPSSAPSLESPPSFELRRRTGPSTRRRRRRRETKARRTRRKTQQHSTTLSDTRGCSSRRWPRARSSARRSSTASSTTRPRTF